jgi:hypothetical protein
MSKQLMVGHFGFSGLGIVVTKLGCVAGYQSGMMHFPPEMQITKKTNP